MNKYFRTCISFLSRADFYKRLPIYGGAFFLSISLLFVFFGCGQSDTKSQRDEFDDQGRIVKKISLDGSETSYEYDEKGQVTKIADPDKEVQLGYDARGNVVLVEDDTGRTERSYDNLNRLTEVKLEGEPNKSINYNYDSQGYIARKSISSGETQEYQVDYKYDLLGNILSVDDGNSVIRYEYDPINRTKVRILPNGVKSIFTYGQNNEVLSVNHLLPDNKPLAKYTYQYDLNGNLTENREEDPQGLFTTRYEWKNQNLSGLVTSENTSLHFDYDAAGNRIAMEDNSGRNDYQYDNSGKITNAGDITFTYNDNGNLVKREQADKYHEIEYYSDSKPSIIKTPEQEIEFKYNGRGDLIFTKNGDEEIKYLPDAFSLDGTALNKYSEKENIFYTYGDSLLSSRNNGESTYYLEDGWGSNRLSLDGGGNIVDRNDKSRFRLENKSDDPFGDWSMNSPPDANFLGDPTPLEIKDPETYSHELISASSMNFKMEKVAGITSSNNKQVQPVIKATLRDKGYENYDFFGFMIATPIEQSKMKIKYNNFIKNKFISEAYGVITGYVLDPKISFDITGQAYWRSFDTGEPIWSKKPLGNGLKTAMVYIDPASQQIGRWVNGGPFLAMDDIPRYARARLIQMGGRYGLVGYFAAVAAAHAAQETGIFFGTRWDRPFSLLDWRKWMAEKDYQAMLKNAVKNPAAANKSNLTDIATSSPSLGNLNDQTLKKKPNPDNPHCPPFCPPDDGNGGGGGVVSPSSPTAILDNFEKDLGGISLDATARPSGEYYFGNITGAVWDDEKKALVLLGDQTNSVSGINPEDLAVALKAVYWGEDPEFSLDPADPQNPSGPNLKAVYYGPIENTSFGQAMFDADWRMKEYGIGVRLKPDGKEQEIVSKVPGYKDIFELKFALEAPGESYTRFWITCEDAPIY
ncbi:MAG: hypothetical protein WC901_04700, partial [Candidatus Margulisiibacteriota bacterium]